MKSAVAEAISVAAMVREVNIFGFAVKVFFFLSSPSTSGGQWLQSIRYSERLSSGQAQLSRHAQLSSVLY